MSLGEYLYIYSLAHFAWREHAPDGGPKIANGRGRRDQRVFIGDHPFAATNLYRRYHRFALAVARNQLDSIRPSDQEYEKLEREIHELEKDRQRVLWGDRLPWNIEAAFVTAGSFLAYSYDPMTDCFEFPLSEEEWRNYRPSDDSQGRTAVAASKPRPTPAASGARAESATGSGLDSDHIRDVVNESMKRRGRSSSSKKIGRLDRPCENDEYIEAVRADNVRKVYACGGADPQYKSQRAFNGAISQSGNRAKAVRLLLDSGADPTVGTADFSPLLTACMYQRNKVARMLLDAGCDPNHGSYEDSYPLFHAVGDLELFQALLDAGADPTLGSFDRVMLQRIRKLSDKDEYLASLAAVLVE
jgi:hypothetical protein